MGRMWDKENRLKGQPQQETYFQEAWNVKGKEGGTSSRGSQRPRLTGMLGVKGERGCGEQWGGLRDGNSEPAGSSPVSLLHIPSGEENLENPFSSPQIEIGKILFLFW